jgi:hypothetical protein
LKKIFRSLLAFSFVGVFLLVTPAESIAAIAEQPCNQYSWTGEDDNAHQMSLPYNLPLGDTTYSTTYVTTNGTLTFGAPDATFNTYPSTPSISLAGYDWVTFGEGTSLSYGVTNTGFCVEWKVRPFPQSEGDITTIKLTVDTSRLPTWSGIVETTGWLPADLRRGIRFQSGEEVVQISEAFTINGGRPVEMQTCWDGTIIPMSGTCPAEPPPGQCWDGSTVAYNETCPPVPPDTQCWDGTWVAWSQTCPPQPQPITCWDGSVIPGTETCPAEPQFTCWDNSVVNYESECSPTPPPTTCWDGSVVSWNQTCPQMPPPIECWDGSSVNWNEQCPPEPTSIVVNNLLDDGSQGTLRWAINQANAQSGGIYDSITFSVEGTITLTSNIPNITGQLSISGEDKVSLFGNYRLYASTGSNVTINDLDFNYTYVENERGTLTINSSYFYNSGRSIFNKNGNTTITYVNNSLFKNNGTAISSDWGGTPNIFSVGDSSYDNRIYVNSSTFENNSTAINVERTVIVNNSQFNDNGVAISGRGINKHSVLNSSFNGNGVAIQTFSWIPTSWLTFFDNSSIENNNRLIKGNTFTNNSYAIVLDDSYNNGQRTQKGATVRDNSWDESGIWIRWSQWDGTQNIQTIETTLDSNQESFYSLNNISIAPTPEPTPTPMPEPTPESTPSPSQAPTESPTPVPSDDPTPEPLPVSPEPTETLPTTVPEDLEPSPEPTPEPTIEPEPIIEPEPETDFTQQEVDNFVEDAFSDGSFTEAETEALIENLEADGEISAEEVSNLSDSLTEDGVLTQEDKELLADVLVAQADGEAITSDLIEELGLDYEDLPPEQPVALDNGVILTAEIADAIEIFEDPSELLATIFTDPGKALKAIANIGADMTIETRKEAQEVTVAAVIVTQIISGTSALALARK